MKARLILCLALATGVLQACDTPSEWSPAEAPRQMRVDFQRMTHTAAFAPNSTQLGPKEQDGLSAFLQVAQVTTDDPVYLEAVTGDRLGASRISALARDLTRRGYSVASLPAAPDAVPPNALLVVVERYVVTPPDCPNWTKSSSGDHDNAPSSNFGCSNVTNLGLMVADPRDLVIARQLGPGSAAQAGLAIQRYMAGKTSPLPSNATSSTYNLNVNQGGGSGGSGQ